MGPGTLGAVRRGRGEHAPALTTPCPGPPRLFDGPPTTLAAVGHISTWRGEVLAAFSNFSGLCAHTTAACTAPGHGHHVL